MTDLSTPRRLLASTLLLATAACGGPEVDLEPDLGTTSGAITAPAGLGRYCSTGWAGGGWGLAWYTNLTSDPCGYLSQTLGAGGSVQRAGLISASGTNNVVARCNPAGTWVVMYSGLGGGPLSAAFNAARAAGQTHCVFTASPRALPIFDAPYDDGPGVAHVTGVDFARMPYRTLDLRNGFGQPGASTAATKVNAQAIDRSATGYIDDHDGHDVLMPVGTPLRAVADGVVIAARFRDVSNACPGAASDTQGEVWIRHRVSGGAGTTRYDEVFVSFYAHLDTIDVAEGDVVRRGDLLGTAGNTGCSSAPHLHFGTFRVSNTATHLSFPVVINDDFGAGRDQNSSNLFRVMIDPYGFSPAIGFDPWAWRAHGAGMGALSVNLWRQGEARSTGGW